MLSFYDFIQFYVFTTNQHLKQNRQELYISLNINVCFIADRRQRITWWKNITSDN